jgi:hypothetical protein
LDSRLSPAVDSRVYRRRRPTSEPATPVVVTDRIAETRALAQAYSLHAHGLAMNERRTIPHQLRLVFQSLYVVDPTQRRRVIPLKREIEDTIPDFPLPR